MEVNLTRYSSPTQIKCNTSKVAKGYFENNVKNII